MFDIFYIGKAPGIFPHERRVSSIEEAQELSRTRYFWMVNYLCDYTTWDFLYEPVPWQAHHRHAWRSQYQLDSGTYLVPKNWDGKETNYHTDREITRLAQYEGWILPDTVDIESVDYSWHPNPLDPPYIYHFPSQHQPASGLVYIVPGANEIKLVAPFTVTALPDKDNTNWEVCELINRDDWDWSWHPNPLDPPYIYVWGNQWNPAQYKASIKYVVPGATEIKYMDERTQRLPHPKLFRHNIAVAEFDYSWEPNPFDPPFVYVFGNQWNPAVLEPTVVYTVEGATEIKYIDDLVARVAQDLTNWEILDEIEKFDYSWRPDPTDPPYIYVFGNQWLTPEQRPAIQYRVPSAVQIKYIDEPKARRVATPEKFITHHECEFDYSWEPDPGSPPYNYVFGNQWYPGEIMPTVEFRMEGATETNYVDEPKAILPPRHDNKWHTLVDCDWDYSWIPDPGDPPYIYVFGNQWHSAEIMPTVEYHVPGASERKFMESPIAVLLQDKDCWSVPEEVIEANIDFSWVPDPGSPPYIYHFGTDFQSSVNLTYTVPGATEIKFAGDIPTKAKKSAVAVLDIFFMDRSNASSAQRFAQLQEKYPHIQKIRYVNSIMDTIKRCATKAKTNKFWVIGSENVYDEFNFSWHAQPWQNSMTHVFGSQWNKWSDTFLINKWEFERHTSWAKGIEEFPNLNFVADQQVIAPADAHDIYVVDFGNEESTSVVEYLESKYRVVKRVRYFDNYLDTLKRLIKDVTAEHIWVVGSICDYTRFDFSWQPEAWQKEMLHVFPSHDQKFGDTFFVPVNQLREKIDSLELLDWFDTINYCADQIVPRWPMPVVEHHEDSHVDMVKNHTWTAPLTMFTTVDYASSKLHTVSLWRDKTKTIVPLSSGSNTVIVPQVAVPYIKTQLYDYPYIDKTQRMLKDAPLDVVFISNGEVNANYNFDRLQAILGQEPNKIHRVSNVNGRVASQHAAAKVATTPWYFLVPGKLAIDDEFEFDWQPDMMQQPKHYIFYAKNPVNGLMYGHQAMVAYNKNLVLQNTGQGLDFTMDQAHEVVPINSGTANYANDPWMCWRTAFRECIKLQLYSDVESNYRLSQWATVNNDEEYGEWSIRGAEDAIEFFKTVNGNPTELKKSYEWDWLASYAFVKYPQLFS